MSDTKRTRLSALKVAVSATSLVLGAGLAGNAAAQSAADYGLVPDTSLSIVANHTVPPGPGNPATGANFANSPNVLDPAGSVNGVGQMIAFIQTGPASAGLALCSGTLINPRTVITAAHCVYNNPAHMYGSDTGTGGGVNGPFGQSPPGTVLSSQGIPISFGFSSTNRCLGVAVNGCAVGTGPYEQWRDSNFSTNTALNIYNGNQVWYLRHAQPVALGGGGEFANGDIALVTLDTHAAGIPTWTMLFSPLDGPTHSTITGYGGAGVGLSGIGSLAGIDYRRRSAENMVDALMTGREWVSSPAIGGPGNTQFTTHHHNIYWMDFDDPNHDPNNLPANFFTNTAPPGGRNNGYYDFNGLGGAALPNEGATAGGDSGGPLVIDQRWDIPVIAGVLTGSFSFNGGISTYGQFNVYPPLFLFWEDIVQNNPYVYAGSLPGFANWTDPSHWVQLMDPNYVIIGPDGELVNSVPDTNQGGGDGAVDGFGTVCFLEQSCASFDGPGNPVGDGNPIVTAGGPGSTDFVPNNIEPVNSADPTLHVRARYYDVNLSAVGETWLTSEVTIDKFMMDGLLTSLDVRPTGTLNVWTDFTVDNGFLNVDGRINSGEALLVQGILTGHGTFNPTYLTSVDGVIAPGDLLGVGTLSIQGDVVLASASDLFMEIGRNSWDVLNVTADPLQGTTGLISLGGNLRLVKARHSPAPRHGQVVTIIFADGGVLNTFDQVFAQTGILRPDITYLPNAVQLELRAGRFADVIEDSGHHLSFANALDQLREGSYNLLYDLYGELDVMDFPYLSTAFASLSPVSLFDAHGLMAMQDSGFAMTLQNRMAALSHEGGSGLGFSMMGSPGHLFAFGGDDGLAAAPQLSFASALTQSTHVSDMPNGVSAFFSGGYSDARASSTAGRDSTSADDSLRTWQMVGGVEQTVGAFTIGVGAGYSRGSAAQQGFGALAENEVAQSAVYGVYRLDGGMYVSGLVGAGMSRVDTERLFATGPLDYHLEGQVDGDLYLAAVEGGWNLDITSAMTLTPNASVRHYVVRTGAYTESGGEAALAVAEQLYERSEARMGLRLAGDAPIFGWTLSPTLDAALVANLSGEEGGVWANFAAAPDVSFYLPGAMRDDYWGEIVGGLRLVRGETSFALHMETSVGREEQYEDRYVARFARRF